MAHRPVSITADDDRRLRWVAVAYGAGVALHTADHLRRGVDVITRHVFWGGNMLSVLAVLAIILIFTRHRLAALVATAVGFSQAVGVAAVHLLPRWSALSDSLPDGRVDGWTWAAVIIEIAGALGLGAAGASMLRRDGWPALGAPAPLTH